MAKMRGEVIMKIDDTFKELCLYKRDVQLNVRVSAEFKELVEEQAMLRGISQANLLVIALIEYLEG